MTDTTDSSDNTEQAAQAPEPVAPSGAVPAVAVSLICAAVALVAGTAAWFAVVGIGEVYRLPKELVALGMGRIPSPDEQRVIGEANNVLELKNTALWMSVVGGLVGLAVGVAVGILRPLHHSLPKSAIGGLVGGAAGAALAGLAAVMLDRSARDALGPGQFAVSDSRVMLMHGLTWLITGAFAGLGVAFGRRAGAGKSGGMLRLVAAGGGAAMVGGAVFMILVGILLPGTDPSIPFPKPDNAAAGITWMGLPAFLMGLGIGRNS